jgi:ribosomal protein L37AE/L43A
VSRLASRRRFADDIVLIAKVNGRKLSVADRDRAETINVASDESFIHSLDRLGFVSLVASAKS